MLTKLDKQPAVTYYFMPRFIKKLLQPENRFGAQAPWSSFLNFCKIDILKFQKKLKKYKDVVNYIHYECVNLYYEIPCIAISAKKTKWTKVGTCTQI
jgi:hypothetical protein